MIALAGFGCYYVRLDDAFEARERFADVFDAHSQELWEYGKALVDPKRQDFKMLIQREYEPFQGNVLILDQIQILPAHRGRKLGLAVASKLIEMFGHGCGIVACKPFPLQLSGIADGEARSDRQVTSGGL